MKKFFAMLIVVLTVIACFTGCTSDIENCSANVSESEGSRSLAIVVQRTANSAEPMLTSPEIINSFYDTALRSGSTVTIIEADGEPFAIDTVTASIPEKVSQSKKESVAKQIASQLVQIAQTAAPVSPEVDTLKALVLAARNLNAAAADKRIIYLGSALSTTGALPFNESNLLGSDVNVVVEDLKAISAIPDFPDGTTVVFAGLGDTAAPQTPLSYSNISALKAIWTAICEAGGASVEFITATPTDTVDKSSYPNVSTVSVLQEKVKGSTPSLAAGGIRFDSETIAFEPESYVLSDPEATTELLKPIAEQLINSGETVVVAGTTATVGSNLSCVEFSKKRAQSVADCLTALGVPSAQINTYGLGYENEWHVKDTDSSGNLTTDAQKNRTVIIALESSSDGAKIKQQHSI